MEEKYNLLTLSNGLRVICVENVNTELVHVGITLRVGTRDETMHNNGVAHFIEHAVFKGTSKRKSHQILQSIENVGGELNAFTTREKTCYYASCLSKYAEKAIDVITDLTFNSSFPPKDLDKERKVILEEIDMYDDTPDESVYDEFYSLHFKNHPLGFNILGTSKNVKNLQKEDLDKFKQTHYHPENIVLSVVGNIHTSNIFKLAEKYAGGFTGVKTSYKRKAPLVINKFSKSIEKDFLQLHCMMGTPAYPRDHENRYALLLLNNILGGAAMSNRLSMAVREKHGLTYSITSNYSSYTDAGVFSIYFASDKNNLSLCQKLINKEIKKLRDEKLTKRQLFVAKQQVAGQVAMSEENLQMTMQNLGRGVLDYGRPLTVKEFISRIESVTAEKAWDVANEIMGEENWSELVYLPELS